MNLSRLHNLFCKFVTAYILPVIAYVCVDILHVHVCIYMYIYIYLIRYLNSHLYFKWANVTVSGFFNIVLNLLF